MKKTKNVILVMLVALILVLTGCQSTIAIRTLVPAEVDVSGYKTMAVRSTSDNTSWILPIFWNSFFPIRGSVAERYYNYLAVRSSLDFGVSSRITDAASTTIYKSINTGFFKILDPQLTDSYVTIGDRTGNMRGTFMDAGVDAVLTTEITNLYYDEYIIQEKSDFSSVDSLNNKFYPLYFYAVQKYEITISYRLTDVENNVIIASGSFSSGMKENRTRLGRTKNAAGDFERDFYTIPYASTLFEEQISNFASNFRNALSPHYVTQYFDFMPNKPKVQRLEDAYEALDYERWETALQIFADEYKRSGHGAAGYNAAILYFTTGQREKAYELAQELYRTQGMTDALDLYYDLKKIEETENAATKQINSTEKSGATGGTTGGLAGF